MRDAIALLTMFCAASVASGEVSTRVCLADGSTPLELADPNVPFVYRDIMVGTRLTIIVSSDVGGYWAGDLAIMGEDRLYGMLSARAYDEKSGDWTGSHLEAASFAARVLEWIDPAIHGFSLEGCSRAEAGDWFILDYTTAKAGLCNVAFYDRSISWDNPVYYLTFLHVPTRDFSNDTRVDFVDFAIFASCWQAGTCDDPDWCEGADLDSDGDVDVHDLAFFGEYWLDTTAYGMDLSEAGATGETGWIGF